MISLLIPGVKRIRKKLKALYKNKKRTVGGLSKEEVTHGGPIQGISPIEFWKKNLRLNRIGFLAWQMNYNHIFHQAFNHSINVH